MNGNRTEARSKKRKAKSKRDNSQDHRNPQSEFRIPRFPTVFGLQSPVFPLASWRETKIRNKREEEFDELSVYFGVL